MRIKSILLMIVFVFASTASAVLHEQEGNIKTSHGSVWYKKVYTKETASATPLLMVHGGPGFTHDYFLTLKELAAQQPVIFYDQLGCGKSLLQEGETVPATIDYYTDELACVIEALGYDKVHLYAHSWGGSIAVHYLAHDQSRVSRVILASPLLSTEHWISDSKKLVAQLAPEVRACIEQAEASADFDNKAYQAAVHTFYTQYFCRLPEWPQDLLASFAAFNLPLYLAMWGPSEFTVTGTLRDFDCFDALAAITIPILVTCGRFDSASPETMSDAVELLPNGKLAVFEQSSHCTFLDEPEAYRAAVAGFIGDQ